MTNNTNLENFGYEQSLKRVMPLGSIVLYGLAYMAPGTIFGTYGLVTGMTHGMLALTYAIALLAMLFTALSYSDMVRAFPIAGSAYSYVQRSINPHVGFLAGWAILMDYLLIPMLNYIIASLFLGAVFPTVPSWVWILSMLLIVTMVNYIGIQMTSWANNTLVIAQFIFIGALLIFIIKWLVGGNGAATFFDWNAIFNAVEFNQDGMGLGILLTGASILALSFLGFDAVTTIVEEAKDPEKNVGRAILIICIGAGGFFIFLAYCFQLAWPTAWKEFASPDTGAYEMIVMVAGSVMGYFFTAITVAGTLASALASQASASRILFGMGRDGVLPKKFFGFVHAKHKTPTNNIILIGVISLVALVLNLGTAVSLVNFGALAGFALVNLSVVFHYYIRKKQRSAGQTIKYLLFPLIGAAVCVTIWLSLATNAKMLGFAWLGIGFVYLAITTNFFRKLPPDLKLE
jgi:amino acid transporter